MRNNNMTSKIGLIEVEQVLNCAQVMHISMDLIMSITFGYPTQQCTDWIFKSNEGYDGI